MPKKAVSYLNYSLCCETSLSAINANVCIKETVPEPEELIRLMIKVPLIVWDLYFYVVYSRLASAHNACELQMQLFHPGRFNHLFQNGLPFSVPAVFLCLLGNLFQPFQSVARVLFLGRCLPCSCIRKLLPH